MSPANITISILPFDIHLVLFKMLLDRSRQISQSENEKQGRSRININLGHGQGKNVMYASNQLHQRHAQLLHTTCGFYCQYVEQYDKWLPRSCHRKNIRVQPMLLQYSRTNTIYVLFVVLVFLRLSSVVLVFMLTQYQQSAL